MTGLSVRSGGFLTVLQSRAVVLPTGKCMSFVGVMSMEFFKFRFLSRIIIFSFNFCNNLNSKDRIKR